MRRLRILFAVLLAAGALAVAAGDALAVAPANVDCNKHQKLTKHYTDQQLSQALATMPPSIKEYTGCYNLINDQLLRQEGKPIPGSSGAGGGGGSSAPLIIALIVIVLAGGGFAFYASRRGGGSDAGGGGAGVDSPEPPTTPLT